MMYTEQETGQIIRNWQRDVELMETSTKFNRAAIRCQFWNWLTAPYILRSDREHAVCNRLAKRVKAELGKSNMLITQSDSGCYRAWPQEKPQCWPSQV